MSCPDIVVKWSTGDFDGKYQSVYDLAFVPGADIDGKDLMFVSDDVAHKVFAFRPETDDREFVADVFGSGGFGKGIDNLKEPKGLTVVGSYVYVCDSKNHRVLRRKISVGSSLGVTFGDIEQVAGRADGWAGGGVDDFSGLDGPIAVSVVEALGGSITMFIAEDGSTTKRIVEWTYDAAANQASGTGVGVKEVVSLQGYGVKYMSHDNNYCYFASPMQNNVYYTLCQPGYGSSAGLPTAAWEGLDGPVGAVYDSIESADSGGMSFIVTDQHATLGGQVLQYYSTKESKRIAGGLGYGGQIYHLTSPGGLAYSSSRLYIADVGNKRVVSWDKSPQIDRERFPTEVDSIAYIHDIEMSYEEQPIVQVTFSADNFDVRNAFFRDTDIGSITNQPQKTEISGNSVTFTFNSVDFPLTQNFKFFLEVYGQCGYQVVPLQTSHLASDGIGMYPLNDFARQSKPASVSLPPMRPTKLKFEDYNRQALIVGGNGYVEVPKGYAYITHGVMREITVNWCDDQNNLDDRYPQTIDLSSANDMSTDSSIGKYAVVMTTTMFESTDNICCLCAVAHGPGGSSDILSKTVLDTAQWSSGDWTDCDCAGDLKWIENQG